MRFFTDKISAKRRSRFAGPLVLLAALVLVGLSFSVFGKLTGTAQADNGSSTADIAAGRALFQVGCASCHGSNAQGILTVKGDQYGPSLIGVGAAAVDFQVGTGRMPMAQAGQQVLAKRVTYSDQEISQLAAYVASLGPGPAIPSANEYNYKDLTARQIAEGGQFFRTNCTACHNFEGSGGAMPEGKFAPKLTKTTAKHIFEAMLTGPQQMPSFSNGDIPPQAKKEIIGYLKTLDSAPKYGGFGLGGIGPVAEGLAAWLFGIGGLVVVAIWIAAHTARSSKKKKVEA